MERIANLFSEYLRTNGHGAARQLVQRHGGKGADFESVPFENVSAFARDLGLTVADHAQLTGRRDDLPDSLSTSDPKFADFQRRAFDKFNGRGHA